MSRNRTLGISVSATALLVGVLLLPLSASGQYLSLDRQRDQNEFGFRLDFGFPKVDGEMSSDETYFRTEIYGQVAFGEWGGYLNIPISRNIVQVGPREEVTAFGNLEVGAFHTLSSSILDMVLRVGLTLPTADDTVGPVRTARFANFGRLTDQINVFPDIVGLRLSASPMLDFGVVFLRADIGMDLGFGFDDSADSVPTFFRANIGIGAKLPLVTAVVELANIVAVSDDRLTLTDDSMHAITVGAFVDLPVIHPYVSATFPIDQDTRENYGMVFTIGADIRL